VPPSPALVPRRGNELVVVLVLEDVAGEQAVRDYRAVRVELEDEAGLADVIAIDQQPEAAGTWRSGFRLQALGQGPDRRERSVSRPSSQGAEGNAARASVADLTAAA
jgi:hypothetical protein